MTFAVDGYIAEGLAYLETGQKSLLQRGEELLKPGDHVTAYGLGAFAKGVDALIRHGDGIALFERMPAFFDSRIGQSIVEATQSSLLASAQSQREAAAPIIGTEASMAIWSLILLKAAEQTRGIFSTDTFFMPLLQRLTVDYLEQQEPYARRLWLLQIAQVSESQAHDHFKQTAARLPLFINVSSDECYRRVMSSTLGLQGLIDAGMLLGEFSGAVLPLLTTRRIRQPKYLERLLCLTAEHMRREPGFRAKRVLTNLVPAKTQSSPSKETRLWTHFFHETQALEGSSFTEWARLLARFHGKSALIEAWWEDPLKRAKLETLPADILLPLISDLTVKRDVITRYPELRAYAFSQDLGL